MEDIEDIASSVMDAVEMGLVVDQWVAVRFENYWYPGQITKVKKNGNFNKQYKLINLFAENGWHQLFFLIYFSLHSFNILHKTFVLFNR